MMQLKYETATGEQIDFTYENNYLINTVEGFSDMDVDIATSQGYAQIGETISNMSIAGRYVGVTGRILGKGIAEKRQLIQTFAPLSTGKLWVSDKYWLEVTVATTPQIENKDDALFVLDLFAAYPLWRARALTKYQLGGIIPQFRFPLNYATPHRFGTRAPDVLVNCHNPSGIQVPFTLRIYSYADLEDIVNPKLINIYTGESVSFTHTLLPGETLLMQQVNGQLEVTHIGADGVESDAFESLDESSDLFFVHPGDNILRAEADFGQDKSVYSITFYDVLAGVCDGM